MGRDDRSGGGEVSRNPRLPHHHRRDTIAGAPPPRSPPLLPPPSPPRPPPSLAVVVEVLAVRACTAGRLWRVTSRRRHRYGRAAIGPGCRRPPGLLRTATAGARCHIWDRDGLHS